MKFSQIFKPSESEKGSNLFLKINDGESVNLVLRGEIYTFYSIWNKAEQCSEVVSLDTLGSRRRFRVNAIVFENGAFVAKIFEFSTPLYRQFAELAEEYDVTEIKIKITRCGEKKKTTYLMIPLFGKKDVLTPKALKEIQAVELLTLEHDSSAEKEESNEFNF